LELIKFDVSNTSYYVEVENGALFTQSWKLIVGGHGKSWEKSWRIFRGKCGTMSVCCRESSAYCTMLCLFTFFTESQTHIMYPAV